MKQTRIIRISFLVCAVIAVAAFWSGFYFGENSVQPEQILTASEQSYENSDTQASEAIQDNTEEETKEEDEQTVESMKGIQEERYYLKLADEYLAVYFSDTDSMYFETDIKLSDLPSDMQSEAMAGIPFENLEELYSFLENYSS